MDDQPYPGLGAPRQRLHIDQADLAPEVPASPAPVTAPVVWAASALPVAPMPAVGHAVMPVLPSKGTVMGVSVCPNCSGPIDPRAMACPRCGLPTPTAIAGQVGAAVLTMNRKSTGVALLLSVLWPGVGQIYVGRFGQGAAFMFGSLVAAMLMVVLIGFLIYPAVLIWAMIDAYKAAEQHNLQLMYGTHHQYPAQR
jgi:TM2 domain-containing membrane protein YozV